MIKNPLSTTFKKITLFRLILVVLVVSASLAIGWARPAKASHAPGGCPPIQFTRCSEHGYFTGANMSGFGTLNWVWDPSRNWIDTSTEFIDAITTDLNTPLPPPSCPNDIDEPCVKSRAATVGAAFIIATMLGQNPAIFGNNILSGAVGVNWARQPANYNRWLSLVNQYTTDGLVDYDFPDQYDEGEVRADSLAFNYGADVSFYQNSAEDDSRFIIFRHPTDPTREYRINKTCGNVTGIAEPLVPPPPRPQFRASCDIDAPSDTTVGTAFQASFTVTNTGRDDLNESDMSPPSGMTSANDPPALWGKQNFAVQVEGDNILQRNESTNWAERGFTAPNTVGRRDFTWEVRRLGTVIATCTTTINVGNNANRPIIRVNGGDIFAGANFSGYDIPCSDADDPDDPSPDDVIGYFDRPLLGAQAALGVTNGHISRQAHIDTWGIVDYHLNGGRYGMLGASTSQYAVFSSGEAGYEFNPAIGHTDFDRSHLNHILGNDGWIQPTNPTFPPPDDQTQPVADFTSTKDAVFTNNIGKGGRYGDFYRGLSVATRLPCVEIGEFTNTDGNNKAVPASANTIAAALNDEAPVVTFAPGGVPGGTLNINAPLPIPQDKTKVIIVDGNINIRRNITYPPSYDDVDSIPYLQLIATGKINIYRDVTQIDAHLLAFPRDLNPDSGSGTIDTCADADPANIGEWPDGGAGGAIAVNANNCPRQLAINGTLTARRVYLKRTLGTMSSDINNLDNSVPPYDCRIQDGDGGHVGDKDFNALVRRYNRCAAELINFYPEAYIANLGTDQDTGVDSIPTNSVELPPIY